MASQFLIRRRDAARLVMGPFAALCIAVPASALSAEQDKAAAEKVARKVEKAKESAREESVQQAAEEHEALQRFQKRLKEYTRLHNFEYAKLGARESAETQQALAIAIAARRDKARPGDLFLTEVQPIFRRRIAQQLKGPDALAARKAVAEGNPGHEEETTVPVPVRVNVGYPSGASRSTVPASVLLTLPPLPECLHYRFVDRDLILVDAVAQLIVDFVKDATPALPAK